MLQELAIKIQGLPEEGVYVESLHGREGLSDVYAFVVDIISRQPIDVSSLLGKAGKVELKVVDEEMVVNGIISEAMALDPTPNREFCYRFVIAPELSLLKHSAQNQVYGTDRDMTVVDVVQGELVDANKAESRTAGNRTQRTIRSQMLVEPGNYPKLEFLMQYRESDFDFISRITEKFGIFYFFDTAGDKETVVFCDRKEHFRRMTGRSLTSDLPFRGGVQIRAQGDFAVRSFRSRYRVQSGAVELREYNDLTPTVDLCVSQATAFDGFGVWVDYAENYRAPADGRTIAQKRAEQLATARLEFEGESNIPLIRPGYFFKLVDHPDSAFEAIYVVTEVEHAIVEPTPLGFGAADRTSEPYRNRFRCIPFDTQYRPPFKTPKPVVGGFLLGVIDGENDTGRAELDDYGRYRIRIMDEESALTGGRASYWIRKLEPYGGGAGYGQHSTLLVGTEVLIGFLHGDPDRPVIMGAFSNAEQSNTVTGANRNVAHRMRTASGTILQISDGNP